MVEAQPEQRATPLSSRFGCCRRSNGTPYSSSIEQHRLEKGQIAGEKVNEEVVMVAENPSIVDEQRALYSADR